MKTHAQIRQQLAAGQFDFSRHAFKRAIERNISEEEIRAAGAQTEIIEEYPEDKYLHCVTKYQRNSFPLEGGRWRWG